MDTGAPQPSSVSSLQVLPQPKLPVVGVHSLPLELLSTIFDHLNSEENERTRRTSLSSSALVCQAWTGLANPLLYSHLEIPTYRQVVGLNECGALGRYETKSLKAINLYMDRAWKDIESLVDRLSGLTELVIRDSRSVSTRFFEHRALAELQTLRMSNVLLDENLTEEPSRIPFQLTTLELRDVDNPELLEGISIASMLTGVSSIQALAIDDSHQMFRSSFPTLTSLQLFGFVMDNNAPDLSTYRLFHLLSILPLAKQLIHLKIGQIIPDDVAAIPYCVSKILTSLKSPLESLTLVFDGNEMSEALLKVIQDDMKSVRSLEKVKTMRFSLKEVELEQVKGWKEFSGVALEKGVRLEYESEKM